MGSGSGWRQNSNGESQHRIFGSLRPEVLMAKRPVLRIRAPGFLTEGNFTPGDLGTFSRRRLGRFGVDLVPKECAEQVD